MAKLSTHGECIENNRTPLQTFTNLAASRPVKQSWFRTRVVGKWQKSGRHTALQIPYARGHASLISANCVRPQMAVVLAASTLQRRQLDVVARHHTTTRRSLQIRSVVLYVGGRTCRSQDSASKHV